MSTAVTALRGKAQSYFRDAQRFAEMPPLDAAAGGLSDGQWVVVYRAVATELHKVADEIQKRDEEDA